MTRFLHRMRAASAYPTVFGSIRDVWRFRRLLAGSSFGGAREVSLVIKTLGGVAQRCRPKTTDALVLWDTFYERYHLPPPEVRNPRRVVDLGANVGFTTAHFASRFQNARVLAVEMDAGNAELAARNIEPWNDRCTVVNAAVWTEDGFVKYGGDEEWGFAVCSDSPRDDLKFKTARARSLSSLFREFEFEQIDYLKMDIEGAEDPVLRESSSWLQSVATMKVEIHAPGASYNACEAALNKWGFSCRPDERHGNCLIATR
jgi:FkbM family methyltransferase